MNEDPRLQQFLDLLDGRRLDDKQVTRIIEMLAKYVISGQEKTDKTIEAIQKGLETVRKQIKDDNDTALNGIKGQVDSVFVGERVGKMEGDTNTRIQALDAALDRFETRLKELKDGKDGEQGEKGDKGDDGSPDTPLQVRNKLETLKGEERLDASAVKGLDDVFKDVKRLKSSASMGGTAGRDLFKDYDLSSELDGVTKTFDLPATWNIISVHLSSFPHALRKGTDFTYTPTSITFTSEIDAATSLAEGQTCILTLVVS